MIFLCAGLLPLSASAQLKSATSNFQPFSQWQSNLIAHDIGGLKALYSTNPAARVVTEQGKPIPDAVDSDFWKQQMDSGLSSFSADVSDNSEPQPGIRQIIFQAAMKEKTPAGARTLYVSCLQVWQQQGSEWKILASGHGGLMRLKQPVALDPNIYPEGADAHAEISEALAQAKSGGKRVLLVFGGNWCYDCDVLDLAFHQPELQPFLDRNFVVSHIDIGKMDKNQDIANRYQVPIEKGVPAIAVLDSTGKLLYSQRNGEFEKARSLGPEDILAFLQKWKPER